MRNATEPAMMPAKAPVESPPLPPLESDDDEEVGETLAMAEGYFFRMYCWLSSPFAAVGRIVGSSGVDIVTAVVLYVVRLPSSVVVMTIVVVTVTGSVE